MKARFEFRLDCSHRKTIGMWKACWQGRVIARMQRVRLLPVTRRIILYRILEILEK